MPLPTYLITAFLRTEQVIAQTHGFLKTRNLLLTTELVGNGLRFIMHKMLAKALGGQELHLKARRTEDRLSRWIPRACCRLH